jgi:hypothetical protein
MCLKAAVFEDEWIKQFLLHEGKRTKRTQSASKAGPGIQPTSNLVYQLPRDQPRMLPSSSSNRPVLTVQVGRAYSLSHPEQAVDAANALLAILEYLEKGGPLLQEAKMAVKKAKVERAAKPAPAAAGTATTTATANTNTKSPAASKATTDEKASSSRKATAESSDPKGKKNVRKGR